MSVYSIVVRSAPSTNSGGGQYRRPVRILVVQGAIKGCYRHGDKDVIESWENEDSRYQGPRSGYGKAWAAAVKLRSLLTQAEALRIRFRQTVAGEFGLGRDTPLPILRDRLEDQGYPELAAVLA